MKIYFIHGISQYFLYYIFSREFTREFATEFTVVYSYTAFVFSKINGIMHTESTVKEKSQDIKDLQLVNSSLA